MSHRKLRAFKTTSLKVHIGRWLEFKAKSKLTAGDLLDKCIYKYLNDPEFKQEIDKFPLPPGL